MSLEEGGSGTCQLGCLRREALGAPHGATIGLALFTGVTAAPAVADQHILIRQVLTGSGDIDPHDGVLTVRLDPLPTWHAMIAIAELCEHLTATHTLYPGTNQTLRYEVKARP